jgi:putative ABC transport system permease protein
LAKRLGVKVGDEISFGLPGERTVSAKVGGIAENYIFNYIYLPAASYEFLFGRAPAYSSISVDVDNGMGDYSDILADIVDTDNVVSAISIDQVKDMMNNMTKSLNSVVWMIIIVGALLALVVLYNLININITERERELATLKVLGFYRNEVSAYISRESVLLTMIGMAVGLFVGVFLHSYVMAAVEVNEVMFGRTIMPLSYVYSGLFTLLCVIIINLIMRPKIMRIDPVSSLKSAE